MERGCWNMEKKPLTLTQKKNKYRALQYTTFVGKYIALLTPFIVMGIVNAEDWFYTDGGWKVGLGGTLALALLGIITALVTNDDAKRNESMSKISLLLGWIAATFVVILLEDILNQIATIMIFGSIGLFAAVGIDFASKDFKNKADKYKATIEKGKEKMLEEQFIEENKSNEIRF